MAGLLDRVKLKKMKERIEAQKKIVQDARDELRDIIDELDEICDCCHDASEDLERATDRLSQYL